MMGYLLIGVAIGLSGGALIILVGYFLGRRYR